ncbi:hypothetical protein ALC56_02638 [Trachymyrmex septentrionalis]|uniref:Uncharacterized protein n=1 Tax=Trachymyrmex septentrionalis TaxID=34720 RepID=A0A195FQY5_9HYME|nr:hypothetical protein ALC56_02638 [Trachymyrmex septentrionalis]
MRTDASVSQMLIMTFRAVFIADCQWYYRLRRARVHRVASAAAQRREKGDNNEEEKSGEERRRWLAMGREPASASVCVCACACACAQVCVGGDGGRRGLMVCDDAGGAGDSGGGGGGGDGGGEIYTGCQPPNNVIALYKLRERGEQRCSTLKPPSAP